MSQESFSIEVLIFLIVLTVYVLASYFIDKCKISFLHQSTIAIVLGFIIAIILKLGLQRDIVFSDQLFFALLLPPIVFSVGYQIKKDYFFNNFPSILFLGIFSTLFTIGLFAFILSFLNSFLSNMFSVRDILLLSIIISSSDPITALPLIKKNHPKLNAIVSGQSILNSAVVIILFGTISKVIQENKELNFQLTINILLHFVYLFLFSLLLGIFFGLTLSYIFKKVQSFAQHPIKQTSLIILTGYMVYLIGGLMGLSGIIALFTTAIIFSMYGFNNLSYEAKHGTLLAFQTVRYISQAFIFAYLGASLLTANGQWSALGLAVIIVVLIPIIRFLSVALLPLLYKISSKPFILSTSESKMLWYTGLMRGVIAFALSLQIQSNNRVFMITVALVVVMFTTITGASFLKTFANFIDMSEIGLLKIGQNKNQNVIEMMPSTKYQIIGGAQSLKEANEPKRQNFRSFEQKFIKPMFLKKSINDQNSNYLRTVQL